MPLFLLLNRLFVLPSSSLSIVCALCVCSHVGVCSDFSLLYVCVLYSHRCLSSSDPSGASDHHRPDARPAPHPAQPRPCHHTYTHASDPSDPELHSRAGSQSTSGAGAARARIWNHLHALWVSLHTHALHIGIPDWLNWSIRYIKMESPALSCVVNGCIMRTGYWTPIKVSYQTLEKKILP